jgi:hypothetical protein
MYPLIICFLAGFLLGALALALYAANEPVVVKPCQAPDFKPTGAARPLNAIPLTPIERGGCLAGGIQITPLDQLRAAVTVSERRMATLKDIDGRSITMLQIRAAADAFAEEQTDPAGTLALLRRCGYDFDGAYSHGYAMVSGALVRATLNRHPAGRK